MRLCFFGDSIVNGTGDDDALGWSGRVVARARRRGADITYYNLGIRRDTSADIARRWRGEAAARLPADAPKGLAFSFGTNDCAHDGKGMPRVPHRTALSNTGMILQEAVEVGPTLMLGPAPVLDDAAIDGRVRRLSGDLGTLCSDIGVPFLATFDFVADCPAWRREARAGDGTHPNRDGYAALADYVEAWPAFRRWLAGDR